MASLFPSLFSESARLNDTCTAIALGAIGGVVLPQLSKFVAWVRLHFMHRSKLWRFNHSPSKSHSLKSKPLAGNSQSGFKNDHAWALVTGASDGIGYGFVQELANYNFNVILHGRNPSKIEKLVTELTKQHPTLHFEPFVVDATDRTAWSSAFDSLINSLSSRNICLTVLVNNIGGNPLSPRPFFMPVSSFPPDQINKIIDFNATFPSHITNALLPVLTANAPSLILNMSSATSTAPIPYLAPYGSSKAYNSQFSKILRLELMAEGHPDVEVMNVLAAKVQSGGQSKDSNTARSVFVPTSQQFAKSVLRMVGCGRPEVMGWWAHDLQLWLATNVVPRRVMEKTLIRAGSEQKEIFWREYEQRQIGEQT